MLDVVLTLLELLFNGGYLLPASSRLCFHSFIHSVSIHTLGNSTGLQYIIC